MADLVIKPSTGGSNTLILQDEGGDSALTIGATGNTTLAGTANNLGTVTAGSIAGGSITSATTFPAGHILNVVQRSYTTSFAQTIDGTQTSHNYVNNGTEDLYVAITPSSADNDIHLTFSIGKVSSNNSGSGYGLVLYPTRNGTAINTATDSGTHPKGSFSMSTNDLTYDAKGGTFSFIDSPNTTSLCTYKLKAIVHSGTNYTVLWNRGLNISGDAVSGHGGIGTTNFIAMEVQR